MPTKEEIRKSLAESFPFSKPRPEQEQAFDSLTPWMERLFIQEFKPLFFGVDAPTGTGKSLIAVTVARSLIELLKQNPTPPPEVQESDDDDAEWIDQVWIVTANKLLQDQYLADFENHVFDIRGLDNYDCFFDPGKTCGQSKCARLRPPSDQPHNAPKFCSKDCEYDRVKKTARMMPILLMNVAKALTFLQEPNWPLPRVLIFDEGHQVESALDNEAGIVISPESLAKVELTFSKFFLELDCMDAIHVGLKKLINQAAKNYEEQKEAPAALRDSDKIRKLEALIRKVHFIQNCMKSGIQYVSCAEDKLDLRPLKIHQIFRNFFNFPVLFLSATLLSKDGFQSMTGLGDRELDWFSVPSPFPKENRPIMNWWRIGATPLNYQNLSDEMENLYERIRTIMLKHPTEKGLIHTHTYKIAEAIHNNLFAEFGDRLLFPKSAKEQKDILAIHGNSRKPTVLLSPSMTEGVDLKDDLCRFMILAKVPYLPTGDKVVAARMETDPAWYEYRTAMSVVQGPGRGVRSTTDHAITYLIDPGFQRFFGRAKAHFPPWFLEALQPKAQGPV